MRKQRRQEKKAAPPVPALAALELLTAETVAAMFGGLSLRTLERWRVEGRGPRYIKVGKRVMYRQQDLAAFVESRARRSTSEAA